jgi:hypothetical protein
MFGKPTIKKNSRIFMSSLKRILVLVPDGTGIKNYLYSNTFKNKEVSLSLFHNFNDDTLATIREHLHIDSFIQIPFYKESVSEKFLRELIHLSRLRLNSKKVNNPSILKFWKGDHKSLKLRLFYGAIIFRAGFVMSYDAILKLEKAYDKALGKNPFYEEVSAILKKNKPDVVFCTHQRALKAPIIFKAAGDLGISTSTVIYSWDNLPKARLALRADKYLVWSNHMKDELQLLYPEISVSAIRITGTPQFEFYKDPSNIIEKGSFYDRYSLDPTKKMVCFSGDDIKTSPFDPEYLDDVARAIVESGLDKKIQLVFRRCPVDVSGRYDWVIRKYRDLIVEMPPLWNFNSELWTAVYPTYEDVKLLVSLAYYADVVINVGSTMAFDFGMFNKPCIFINYDHIEDQNWSVKTIYKYQHFRSMPSKKAVYWFDHKNEIAATINSAIEIPHTEIKAWYDVVVHHTETASERILNELME